MKEVIAEQFNLVAFACLCAWKDGRKEATLFWVNCVLIISLITNHRCYFYARDLVSHFRGYVGVTSLDCYFTAKLWT